MEFPIETKVITLPTNRPAINSPIVSQEAAQVKPF